MKAKNLDYTKKKFLVIDDFPEFRSSIKRMVEAFGGKEIDVSSNGEDAMEKMFKTKYDFILSDYNLGEGKDGQQVLEEAKYKKLLKPSSIYIMLTAESTINMVMGALEYEPDGYLTKPFNKAMLFSRLEKISEKKHLLDDVYKALELKKYDKAIVICDKHINEKSKAMLECLKIKARINLDVKHYQNARAIYEKVLDIRKCPWAMLGLGKVLYHTHDYYEAADAFQALIDENTMCVEAYDWLAKAKFELGDCEASQHILEKAVKLSPKAILRQQQLGEIAKKNGDNKIAEKAFRMAVKLGKHSCYAKVDDNLNLARALVAKSSRDSGITAKRASNEAIQVLQDMIRHHQNNHALIVSAALIESEAYTSLKQSAEASKAMKKAEQHFSAIDQDKYPEVILEMATYYATQGDKDKSKRLASKIIEKHFDDVKLNQAIESLCLSAGIENSSEMLKAEEQEKIDDFNKKGVAFFKSGKLQEAVDLFEQAAQEMPHNVSVNLNAAQALIKFMQEHGKNNKMLNRSMQYLDRVNHISEEDERYDRFVELKKLHDSVVKSK